MDVLEAYYSSDDDVAWGPLTLREIKRDLKRTPVKPPRRYSIDLGDCDLIIPGSIDTEAQFETISTITETSLEESRPDINNVPMASEPINLESQSDNNASTSTETSLEESWSNINIPMPRKTINVESQSDIASTTTETNLEESRSDMNIPIMATETINVEFQSDNNVSTATECYFTPDDDASFKENPNNEKFLEKLTSVINGNSGTDKSFATALDTSNFTQKYDDTMLKCIEKNKSLLSLEDERQSLVENTIILSEDEESSECIVISDESYEDEEIVIPGHCVKEEQETSQSSSHVSSIYDVASVDLNSQDNSGSDDSHFEFNDTLAEMEAALKYGLDYQLPEKSPAPKKINIQENILLTAPTANWHGLVSPENSPLPKKTSTASTTSTVSHSSNIPVRKHAINTASKFKTPIRPAPKTKFTPGKFKNVVSPVSVYIKNTPAACLKENVQTKSNTRLNFHIKEHSKENISDNHDEDDDDCEFPAVIYKPAKTVVSKIKRDVILPGSLQKMVTEPTITKHQHRINRQRFDIDKKLMQNDLTINQSQINDDVSFVVQKQTFKK